MCNQACCSHASLSLRGRVSAASVVCACSRIHCTRAYAVLSVLFSSSVSSLCRAEWHRRRDGLVGAETASHTNEHFHQTEYLLLRITSARLALNRLALLLSGAAPRRLPSSTEKILCLTNNVLYILYYLHLLHPPIPPNPNPNPLLLLICRCSCLIQLTIQIIHTLHLLLLL